MDEVRKRIAEQLPDDCKDLVDQLEERIRPQSVIKTFLQQAKMRIDLAAKSAGITNLAFEIA